MNAIEAQGLTRDFGNRRAVDDLSIEVGEGEVFGFLGPNGAGKTTTIRMLTGQIRPTSGHGKVAGFDIVRERTNLKSRIGVVFEQQNLYERLTAKENLEFTAKLYGADKSRVNQMLEMVQLSDRAKDKIKAYSNGMKQRLLIARALLHSPKVLFLDEPTRGLDPGLAGEIRQIVAGLAKQGTTVFLTTHYMEEADQLCDRVAFLNDGRVAAMDTPIQLKLKHGVRSINVVMDNGQTVNYDLDNEDDGKRLGEVVASGRVLTVHSTEATLEDVFVKLTGRRLVG